MSHHLKVLHQQDLIEPAPELARDTRESWWRLKPRSMTWSVDDFEEGTLGRRVAQTAEAENLRFQVRAMQDWLRRRARARRPAGGRPPTPSDTYVPATEEQVRDLADRLGELVREWSAECTADAEEHPDAARRPVRAIARVVPERAGAAVSAPPPSRSCSGAAPPPVRRDPMVLAWLAAVGLSWFGDYAWNVALAWTAAHTLSPVLAGVVLGAEMLPQALLVLLGGVLADRYDPRRLLVAGQLGQAAVLVLGAARLVLRDPRRARPARDRRLASGSPAG